MNVPHQKLPKKGVPEGLQRNPQMEEKKVKGKD